jgi:uncharacterized protein
MMKSTLVLGASINPDRYSNKAILMLKERGHQVIAVGNRTGIAHGVKIEKEVKIDNVDTVTMYLGKSNQVPYYDAILKLNPRRVIFNPGTKNVELEQLANKNGIEVIEACTLVMLSIGEY